MEESVRDLEFNPNGGINTIVQVNDLKNSPGPGKWELRQASKLALQLFRVNLLADQAARDPNRSSG